MKKILYRLYVTLRRYADYVIWHSTGRPIPMRHGLKQIKIIKLQKENNIDTFFETGTFMGHMTYAIMPYFKQIHSIELDEKLHKKACDRFANDNKVHLHQGDSATVLPQLLDNLSTPALFWLDGHYSAGVTARGSKDTPIVEELKAIASHPLKDKHIILVDDARCFIGENDYPTEDELKTLANDLGFKGFSRSNDCFIIRAS